MINDEEAQRRISELRARMLRQRIQRAKHLIQVRATDADLERALRPVNLTQPNKGYSAQLGISTPQANMQDLVQTIALQTIQFQQMMLQNMMQNGNGNTLKWQSNNRDRDRPNVFNMETQTDLPGFLDVPSRDNRKPPKGTATATTGSVKRTSVESPDENNASGNSQEDQDQNLLNDAAAEESRTLARKRLKKYFHFVWAATIWNRRFLIAKQAREKAQLAVLVKGKTGLFQMFWSNRSFKKAIEVLNSLTADSIDLVPKPNAFNLISIFGSKPNPKVNAILEALLTAIEAITLDSVLQTKYGSSDIQHAFYLLFYSAAQDEPWPTALTNGQSLTIILYFVVLRVLVKMLMLFPVESKVIEKPTELAVKNLRALSYLIFRMVRGASQSVLNLPLDDPTKEMLKSIDPNLGSIFTDQNFKTTFKTYESILIAGEKRLKDWGLKLCSDIKVRNEQNLLHPKSPSINSSKTVLAAKTSLITMIGSRKPSLANVAAPVDASPLKPDVEKKEPEIKIDPESSTITQQPPNAVGANKEEPAAINSTIANPEAAQQTTTMQLETIPGLQKKDLTRTSLLMLNQSIEPSIPSAGNQVPSTQEEPNMYKPNFKISTDGKGVVPGESNEIDRAEPLPNNISSNPYAPNLSGNSPAVNAEPTPESTGLSEGLSNETDKPANPVKLENEPAVAAAETTPNLAAINLQTKASGSQSDLLNPLKSDVNTTQS